MVKDNIEYSFWARWEMQDVYLFRIQNESGAYAEFSNYGASITSVVVPDRNGKLENVVLGFDSLEGYLQDNCYIGATIGRFANRISGASFSLDDKVYHLEKNDGTNANHGGDTGFHSRIFDFKIENGALAFSFFSKDGDGGYPGNLQFTVTYQFTNNNELIIDYFATADRRTVLNFTNHSYFNLSAQRNNILEHKLAVNSTLMLENSLNYIPTGIIKPTGIKSLCNQSIKDVVYKENGILIGLNDYYVIDTNDDEIPAAILKDVVSGRRLEVYTSYPGLQIYTGDYLHSDYIGSQNAQFKPFDGICLECQYFPDNPNKENFPSKIFGPDHQYKENIVFKFSTG